VLDDSWSSERDRVTDRLAVGTARPETRSLHLADQVGECRLARVDGRQGHREMIDEITDHLITVGEAST